MTSATAYPNAPDVSSDDYLAIGLATCYLREDGEVNEVQVLEPIPSAALEAILKEVPTSYQWARGVALSTVLTGDGVQMPTDLASSGVQFCDQFSERAIAAVRTYKKRPEAAAHIPIGTTYTEINYSTERKRLLNSERLVSTEDNVKQHEYTHKVL